MVLYDLLTVVSGGRMWRVSTQDGSFPWEGSPLRFRATVTLENFKSYREVEPYRAIKLRSGCEEGLQR